MNNIKHTLIIISLILFSNTIYSQGFIWNEEAESHHKTYKRVQSTRSILPPKVSLEKYLPYIHNQGPVGMCVAYSIATCRTIVYARNHNLTDKDKISAESYSPYYIFQKNKTAFGYGENWNVSSEESWSAGMPMYMRFINNRGFAKIKDVEYPYYYPFTTKSLWDYSIPNHSNLDVEIVKADTFDYIHSILPSLDVEDTTSNLINQMKSELASGKPMIFGMSPFPPYLSNPYFDLDYWDSSKSVYCRNCYDTTTNDMSGLCSECKPVNWEPRSGHALVLIGYDDNKMIVENWNEDTSYVGCFHIVNSWGSDWGDDGKVWIKYEDFVNHAVMVQSLDKVNKRTIFDIQESPSLISHQYSGNSEKGIGLQTYNFPSDIRNMDWIFRVPIFGLKDIELTIVDDTTVQFDSDEIYIKGILKKNEVVSGVLKDKITNSTYEGELKNWEEHGYGVLTTEDGWGDITTQYKGEFVNGEFMNGDAIEIKSRSGSYEGETYKGEFKNGDRSGIGSLLYSDVQNDVYYKYIGEFKYGQFFGKGTMTFLNQKQYIGDFKWDEWNGQGTLTWSNGDKYVGEFKNGLQHGKGTLYSSIGEISYEGEWEDGSPVRNNKEDGSFVRDSEVDVKEKGGFSLISLILLFLR